MVLTGNISLYEEGFHNGLPDFVICMRFCSFHCLVNSSSLRHTVKKYTGCYLAAAFGAIFGIASNLGVL